MGCEGVWLDQPPNAPVDIASWRRDEEFAMYPEGARDKSLVYSAAPPPYPFLTPNHRYLFKRAVRWCPDQFWTEIIAYRLGFLLGVAVPPAFVAWDSAEGECGALIEWFLDYPGEPEERYAPGGDYMTRMIPGYDRKRGRQHNLDSVVVLMTALARTKKLVGDWRAWWCDTLLFDALIGNTDRHQDNWGLLWSTDGQARMAPVFDNGTSLGHEIIPEKMAGFSNPARMERYINGGTHHLRWRFGAERRTQHLVLIKQYIERFPELREHAIKRLEAFNIGAMRTIITSMTEFDIPIPLSPVRAEFICRLTEARYHALVHALTE